MDGSNDGVLLGLKIIMDGFDDGLLLGLELGTEDTSSNGLVKGFDNGSEDGLKMAAMTAASWMAPMMVPFRRGLLRRHGRWGQTRQLAGLTTPLDRKKDLFLFVAASLLVDYWISTSC
jgi:hypothetical protein